VNNASVWQGQHVLLRAVEAEDWPIFHGWDSGVDATYGRCDGSLPFPASKETMMRRTAEWATAKPERDEFRWMIENVDGEVVGTINTHTCNPRSGTLRYGVAVRREHWRKGYASEAVRLVLRYYFDELRYQKANVEIHAFNQASLVLHGGSVSARKVDCGG
jgi:RimJ/RimL family protein N-acetyltransferase